MKDVLWIAMRYTLAVAMLSYGVNKIFGLQFPAPSTMRLLQEYGESSPMRLMYLARSCLSSAAQDSKAACAALAAASTSFAVPAGIVAIIDSSVESNTCNVSWLLAVTHLPLMYTLS